MEKPSVTKRIGSDMTRFTGILAACLIILPLFLTLSVLYRHHSLSDADEAFAVPRAPKETYNQVSEEPKDKLLSGLLSPNFNEKSCLSRYQSVLYRKTSPHKPSPYLISRLRSYEKLHKRCGPHTEAYNKALEQLKSGDKIGDSECNYIVWISYSGLGNKILTLASAFLYALLTNRVLLADPGKDLDILFCEPFPQTSWLLPSDFPLKGNFDSFDQKFSHCHGSMLREKRLSSTRTLPSFLYLHLAHDYNEHDKLFFCDEEQSVLHKVPWLILRTNNYFVPFLFLMPSFENELQKLFPEKEALFHHLGRYIFHPTNDVWGLITRYYKAYLAKADERIGIQIRSFEDGQGPFNYVMDQIKSCFLQEKLLPEIKMQESGKIPSKNPKSKAVLVTSLTAGYYEKVRDMYWQYPTGTGEVIGVYQPSQETFQQTDNKNHDMKALAEIYLLSFSDKLITSAWSTFGYVAQGLGGLMPWIMYKPENRTTPAPACGRGMSMEPCFHAPPFYDCKTKRGRDTGLVVPHVRHCEDMSWGLKLVGRNEL
ncbi:Xyloglucan fucosyltransferase [Dillenia turbinata]|uniref:Fucosyltransferase n=1 Tax=Dillenia turbinata TaxID=194707 RepID=A0AAN8UU08_9MAGN